VGVQKIEVEIDKLEFNLHQDEFSIKIGFQLTDIPF